MDHTKICLEKTMEILIYALSSSYAARSQKKCAVAEPEEFQPFDLQALRNLLVCTT
jgi:hypothetical protein